MSKVFEHVTADLLEQKINQIAYRLQDVVKYLGDDLAVKFGVDYFEKSGRVIEDLIGFRTLTTGLTFAGYTAGGENEEQVFFIVYWDGYRIRGHVPAHGNVYNTDTMKAFGYDEESDIKNIQKRFPESNIEDFPVEVLQFNWDAIEYELVRDFSLRKVEKTNDHTMSLQERIKNIKYYYPQNEEADLFLESCHYSQKLFELGYTEQAEIVYLWAKEMGLESKQFALENFRNLNEYITGEWYEVSSVGVLLD